MNAGASLSAVPSPIEGSGTAWVLLGSWALSPARPTPIPPRHECRGFSALLVRSRGFGGGLAHPFPDVAVFFHESFHGLGTDTLLGLLLQLMDDLLEVLGGILQILLDLLRLVEAARRSTSGARLVIEADEAPGLQWVDPGRYAAVVDLVHAGNMRHGDTVVAQEETMRSHTGAPGGMRAMHLV